MFNRKSYLDDPSLLFEDEVKKLNVCKTEKQKKYKLQKEKNKFKSMIVAAVTFLTISSFTVIPAINNYIESDSVSRNAAGNSEITFVINDKMKEEVPYEKCPEEFDFSGERVAYLDDTGDILNHRYVIMQSSTDDPEKYLHLNEIGEYSDQGCLFKDSRNTPGDDVTVIYGHNLINNGMFGKLGEYADKEGFLGNRRGQDLYDEQKEKYGDDANSFKYADEYGMYRLDIVAAGVYNDLDIVNLAGNFTDINHRDATIDYIMANSDIKSDNSFDENSKIVIFQTCEDGDSYTYGQAGDKEGTEKRVYVVCKATQLVKYKDLPNEIGNGKTR